MLLNPAFALDQLVLCDHDLLLRQVQGHGVVQVRRLPGAQWSRRHVYLVLTPEPVDLEPRKEGGAAGDEQPLRVNSSQGSRNTY